MKYRRKEKLYRYKSMQISNIPFVFFLQFIVDRYESFLALLVICHVRVEVLTVIFSWIPREKRNTKQSILLPCKTLKISSMSRFLQIQPNIDPSSLLCGSCDDHYFCVNCLKHRLSVLIKNIYISRSVGPVNCKFSKRNKNSEYQWSIEIRF